VASPDFVLPPELAANQQRDHGEAGLRWIEGLAGLAREVSRRWDLTLDPPFINGLADYTAPVRRQDGSRVALKLCYLDAEFVSQAAALRAFAGRAAVRLLDADLVNGALLLERLKPGESLSTLGNDTAAMHEAAEIMRQLWQAPLEGFDFLDLDPWIIDACAPDRLPETKRSLPWIARALARAREVIGASTVRRLLHGDLHQDNILSSQRGWLAIDPKGIAGDPAWELAPLLFNDLGSAGDGWRALVRRRIDQLCEELSLDREPAYALAAARALQCRYWSLRDNSEPGDAIIERALQVGEELAKGP
jgi:streptomycin 6-kinase